jgi:hypothetical protein
MKLDENPQLPAQPDTAYLQDLVFQVQQILSRQNQQINAISEGRISGATNAQSVAPLDGTGNPGDFVAKLGAVAQGPVGAQYVLVGWRCVSTGTSTQWLEVIENVRVPPPTVQPTPAPTAAPSPAPAPTPYSQKIQAENATLHGITAVTIVAGYEGTGHADWFRSGFDEYLEFSFTGLTASASGNLTLRYANYGDQTMTVLLNGASTGTMYTFANSGGTWATKVLSGVSFVSGTNTVRLIPEYSGYTYIDYAQFDQLTGAPPPPPPAPAPTPAPPPAPAPAPAPGSAPFYPFGSRLDGVYSFGIKPNGVHTNSTMDAAVKACYDKWKLARLAKSPTFIGTSPGVYAGQTITDGYHVQWGDDSRACVSEGIGYGMLITVLMAGYDANAKVYFDGMYKVARGRPAFGMSATGGANQYLMDWLILPNMVSGDGWSAADGDMDIALALLMAHRQWGSSGAINYYQQALNTINALKAADFATNGVMYARNVSRVSDYMPGHFRAFKTATNDSFWDDARANSLTLAQNVTTNYSPTAKLQPGFLYDPLGSNPRPDTVVRLDRSGIEDIYDQNSVRNPWRWATDYVWSGDTAWKNLANGIVGTLKTSSGGSASGFSYAYGLDGTPRSGLYHEGTTSGCVMAGAMVDSAHQTFLNTLFAGNTGSGFKTAYFESELMLLPLILASGNWWRP